MCPSIERVKIMYILLPLISASKAANTPYHSTATALLQHHHSPPQPYHSPTTLSPQLTTVKYPH
ncbi:hypothetical protein E2C01_098943 [Portunus trituberculatus]|uniref:Uncharacterized protein n=1 Tax=Portunus trituberculatus TaxID=210409 RepID=A0A5B7K2I9_PORTR|nr:hypothetical protein [Portunus trituberculatus]